MIGNGKTRIVQPILALLLLLDCSSCLAKHAAAKASPAMDPAATRRAVESANQDFIVALKKADLKTIADAFEPTAILMTPGADMQRGREEIEKFFSKFLGRTTIVENSSVTVDVTVAGDCAVETGLYTMTTRNGDSPAITDQGKYLVVWHHDGGEHWRILREIFDTSAATVKGSP